MKRIECILTAAILAATTAVSAQAISVGVGIGFGHGGGVFGGVGTSWPAGEECKTPPKAELTKEQRAALTEAQAVTKEIGYGIYETTVQGDLAAVTQRLRAALETEEWQVALQTMRDDSGERVYLTALPVDRLSVHLMRRSPRLALQWQLSLTAVERDGATQIVWASPLRAVRDKDVDRSRCEELQARAVQALVRTAAR